MVTLSSILPAICTHKLLYSKLEFTWIDYLLCNYTLCRIKSHGYIFMDLPYFLTYLRVFLYWIWIRMQILINLFALILMFFGGNTLRRDFFMY